MSDTTFPVVGPEDDPGNTNNNDLDDATVQWNPEVTPETNLTDYLEQWHEQHGQ